MTHFVPAVVNTGDYGVLQAEVINHREEMKDIDPERLITPPEKGSMHVLGERKLFREATGSSYGHDDGAAPIGVLPKNYRQTPWLKPGTLGDTIVELSFVPQELDEEY